MLSVNLKIWRAAEVEELGDGEAVVFDAVICGGKPRDRAAGGQCPHAARGTSQGLKEWHRTGDERTASAVATGA